MTDLRTHQRRAVLARWAKATLEEKSAAAQHASRAYWDGLSAEERSAIMKARARKRKQR